MLRAKYSVKNLGERIRPTLGFLNVRHTQQPHRNLQLRVVCQDSFNPLEELANCALDKAYRKLDDENSVTGWNYII